MAKAYISVKVQAHVVIHLRSAKVIFLLGRDIDHCVHGVTQQIIAQQEGWA